MFTFGGLLILILLVLICMKTIYNTISRSLSNTRRRYYHYDSDDEDLLNYF